MRNSGTSAGVSGPPPGPESDSEIPGRYNCPRVDRRGLLQGQPPLRDDLAPLSQTDERGGERRECRGEEPPRLRNRALLPANPGDQHYHALSAVIELLERRSHSQDPYRYRGGRCGSSGVPIPSVAVRG